MIDPPWPQRKGGLRASRPKQTRSLDYTTLSVDEIFALLDSEVLCRAARRHNVFLWTIDKFLTTAETQMEQRKYKRHARLIWDKGNGVAPAFTVRYSHEYLLWYYKPPMLEIDISQRGKFTTVIREASRAHSRKPDAAYALVEALYPASTYIDVFSREHRPRWQQWGDQTNWFSH